jgi:uncharacterized protein (DUF1919 family)
MYKIIIFGIGTGVVNVLKVLNEKFVIVAYCDNDNKKQGNFINNIPVIGPNEICNYVYDYIIIANQYVIDIRNQLQLLGVNMNNVLPKWEEKINITHKYDGYFKYSLVSNTCLGGFIYKEINSKYLSPFIWTCIEDKDYLKLIKDIRKYLGYELNFITGEEYPVAMLGDIKIAFPHFKTNDIAMKKWNERLERFDFDNTFTLMIITDKSTALKFEELNIKNKLALTDRNYGIENCIVMDKWEEYYINSDLDIIYKGLFIFYAHNRWQNYISRIDNKEVFI